MLSGRALTRQAAGRPLTFTGGDRLVLEPAVGAHQAPCPPGAWKGLLRCGWDFRSCWPGGLQAGWQLSFNDRGPRDDGEASFWKGAAATGRCLQLPAMSTCLGLSSLLPQRPPGEDVLAEGLGGWAFAPTRPLEKMDVVGQLFKGPTREKYPRRGSFPGTSLSWFYHRVLPHSVS